MTVETATYISDLNTANPGATDLKAEGDDHLRLIKTVAKNTFATDSAGNVAIGGANTPNAYGAGTSSLTLNAATQPVIDLNVAGVRTATFDTTATFAIAGTITNIPFDIYTNGTRRFRFESDGRLNAGAIHNSAGAMTGTTNQYIGSGTYTPTLFAGSNAASLSSAVCCFTRVGNVVSVAGVITAGATTASNTFTDVGVSLPIASNLAIVADLGGAGSRVGGGIVEPVGILADTANDRANFSFRATVTTAANTPFAFSYVVL